VARILCFGDSNTHGTRPMPDRAADLQRYDPATRWPGVMQSALGPSFAVIEEGQPGRTTVFDDPIEGEHRNGLRVLPALLESHAPLGLLIVMLGTNDTKQRFGLTTLDIALGLGRLIRAAGFFQPGLAILAVAPPPVVETGCLGEIFAGAAARSAGLSAAMSTVAASEGAGFMDAGAHIAVDPLDGVHFSADAHAALGRAMATQSREILTERAGAPVETQI